jgi:hypothetical protein
MAAHAMACWHKARSGSGEIVSYLFENSRISVFKFEQLGGLLA